MRWANNRSIWFMMSEIIERKYIFLYTDRQRILVDCKLDCTWDLFFFGVKRRAQWLERENRYPGIRARRKFRTCFLLPLDFDLYARRIASPEIIFIWLGRTFTFGIYFVYRQNDDNESKYMSLHENQSKKIKLPRRNLITW